MEFTDEVAKQKRMAGEKAAEFIEDGMIIGLGTGTTAFYMIRKVGELVSRGLAIKAVATSISTEKLAEKFGIPLISVDEADRIDLAIDGVDEIDPHFNAIKGGGGALFREKIIATMADSVIWIMDESKLVDKLGAFPLPVEVLPFGHTHVENKLTDLSLNPVIRKTNGKTFVTDNGNYIIDLHIGKIMDIHELSASLNSIIGVVETGLFLNMCDRIIVGTIKGVKILENRL